MPYDSLTTRSDVQAMIREQVSEVMLTGLQTQSAALNLFTRINVPTNQTRFPILSALPNAYWVNGDTGLKQTTEAAWDNKYLNIEELAAIVPIPDSVLADASFDIWGSIRPLVENAIARALDAAIFFGLNAPASFPDDVLTAATAAGNVEHRGTANAGAGGIAEDLNQTIALLEADGYFPSGFVANPTIRARLRSARGTDGQLLTDVNGGVTSIWGLPAIYPMPGQWPATGDEDAELFALQRESFILGVRQDFTVTASNTATVQDGSGNTTFNAFQQDMTLFRVVFRAGWAVNNPINYTQQTEGSRYPAAVLLSPNT